MLSALYSGVSFPLVMFLAMLPRARERSGSIQWTKRSSECAVRGHCASH